MQRRGDVIAPGGNNIQALPTPSLPDTDPPKHQWPRRGRAKVLEIDLVGRAGFEPATNGLKVRRGEDPTYPDIGFSTLEPVQMSANMFTWILPKPLIFRR